MKPEDPLLEAAVKIWDEGPLLMFPRARLAAVLRVVLPAHERQVRERVAAEPEHPWGCDWPRPVIHIDPGVRFGRPMIRGVSCDIYAGRAYGGEDIDAIADDYGVTRAEVLLACWWSGQHGAPFMRRKLGDWAVKAHGPLASGRYDEIPDPPTEETPDD